MNSKKRKVSEENRTFQNHWEDDYFFIMQNSKVMCLICKETVAVLKEYNIRRHYESKHSDYMKFDKQLRNIKLSALKKELKDQQRIFDSTLHQSSDIVKASYSVAWIIAKKMKPFSDGELVKECLESVIKDVLPSKTKLFSTISLSRQTICRRIEDISAQIVTTLQEKLKAFTAYSLAFDESTDISDTSQLAVFVRGINSSFEITEELLNILSLKDITKGDYIFQSIKKCLSDNKMKLEVLSGLSTDGAPAMVGKNKGAVKLLMNELEAKNINTNDIFVIHCLIHQQHLCAKVLNMNHVMDVVIKTVNYIRSHALQHRQFKAFLEEIFSQYGDLLYFTNVRWLSRGTCLRRFFQLREEIATFMIEKDRPIPNLSDENWLADLYFLVDVTEKINELNRMLQTQHILITDACNYVKAFQMKLKLFESHLRINNVRHFPLLNDFKSDHKNFIQYADEIKKLSAEFDRRFSELGKYEKLFELFCSPFHVDVSTIAETLQLEIIDLQCNSDLKYIFNTISKIDFYKKYATEEKYPNLRLFAQKIISAFGSTYICESTFSKMNFNKSNCRSSLTDANLENQLRCATTNIQVNLDELSKCKQKQSSH